MQDSALFGSFWSFGAFQLATQIIRYTLLAGGAYYLFWVWGKEKYAKRKIQKARPSPKQLKAEIKHSAYTVLIFSLVGAGAQSLHANLGWFRFYGDIHSRGIGYAVFSFVALILLHDTYFYWCHRFMHLPWVFKHVHLVHHTSYAPTPFTIYSFHPLEAILESMIVPIVALFMPLHFFVLVAFTAYTVIFNLLGHLGHEFYGKTFVKTGLFEVMTSTTHHDLHHHQSGSNFGFYFRIWDRICGTENPKYAEKFFEKAQLTPPPVSSSPTLKLEKSSGISA